ANRENRGRHSTTGRRCGIGTPDRNGSRKTARRRVCEVWAAFSPSSTSLNQSSPTLAARDTRLRSASQSPSPWPYQPRCLWEDDLCVTPALRGRSRRCGGLWDFRPSSRQTGTRRSTDPDRSHLARRRSVPFPAATTVSQAEPPAGPALAPTADPRGGPGAFRSEPAASGVTPDSPSLARLAWL